MTLERWVQIPLFACIILKNIYKSQFIQRCFAHFSVFTLSTLTVDNQHTNFMRLKRRRETRNKKRQKKFDLDFFYLQVGMILLIEKQVTNFCVHFIEKIEKLNNWFKMNNKIAIKNFNRIHFVGVDHLSPTAK